MVGWIEERGRLLQSIQFIAVQGAFALVGFEGVKPLVGFRAKP